MSETKEIVTVDKEYLENLLKLVTEQQKSLDEINETLDHLCNVIYCIAEHLHCV